LKKKGRTQMSTLEHVLPPIAAPSAFPWKRYLLDSLLAIAGAMLVTGILYLFQLYPRIPNISIVYLLVVLALASTRGRYASILASLVAFLAFDFFLVPPLYVFTISRVEEWVALFVFLVTAILTSQLAVALRERAEQASRREGETRILYDLVRETNREAKPERQLETIAKEVVEVLSSWGVYDCAILQPDSAGTLSVKASAYQPIEDITFSSDEKAISAWVMAHGRTMGLYDDAELAPSTSARFVQRVIVHSTAVGRAVGRSLRLIPLKLGERVVGVLRLRVLEDPRRLWREERLEEHAHGDAPISFFWTFMDQVTALVERARLQRENLRIEVLQRTDALRAALLSSVSHDLRTPLTSIKAAASSLLQKDVEWDEEEKRGFALAIEMEADRLNRLVGNLLDMTRIEEGALRPEKEEYSLVALTHDVLGRLDPLLHGRDVHTHLPPDDLLVVNLDYLEIDQVLTNLIENAVRYTPAGSPIDVSAQREGEQVKISVADRGPGIPPTDVERVFDKFYRVQQGKHAARYPMGTGLGLAVCKGLVEAHGGRIWAELREGGGLVVYVVLPVGLPERSKR
jgi:two-component system, OmpR family, sensor histidine kinase KdpD